MDINHLGSPQFSPVAVFIIPCLKPDCISLGLDCYYSPVTRILSKRAIYIASFFQRKVRTSFTSEGFTIVG